MVHGPATCPPADVDGGWETDAPAVGFWRSADLAHPTRYVSAGTGVQNGTDLYQSVDNATETVQGSTSPRVPGAPGTTVTDHWMTAPCTARFVTPALSESLAFCSACIRTAW